MASTVRAQLSVPRPAALGASSSGFAPRGLSATLRPARPAALPRLMAKVVLAAAEPPRPQPVSRPGPSGAGRGRSSGPGRGPGRGGPSRGGGRFGGRGGRGRGTSPNYQGGRGRGGPGGRNNNSGGRGRGRGRMAYVEPATIVPINEDIEFDEVRVIGTDREALGVMSLDEAREVAEEAEVDVVLITPDAKPPVVRLVEYSKFKYELDKQKKDASKKQREARTDLKELKIRPGTDVHDYQVRLKSAKKFLSKGDKVKLTLQFRGREMEFKNESQKVFNTFLEDLGDVAEAESRPSMQGRTMSMIIAPKKEQP